MSPFRVIAVLIVLASLAAGRGYGVAAAIPASHGIANDLPLHTTAVSPTLDDARAGDVEEPIIDLFGNEVDEAVGDYRVDVTGDIYERHAPDTEVPRLGPAIG